MQMRLYQIHCYHSSVYFKLCPSYCFIIWENGMMVVFVITNLTE